MFGGIVVWQTEREHHANTHLHIQDSTSTYTTVKNNCSTRLFDPFLHCVSRSIEMAGQRKRTPRTLHWKAFNFGFCWRWRILYSSTSILNCKLGWNWNDRLTELRSSDILQPSWYVLWFITNVFPSYTSASTDRLKTNSRNTHNNVPFPVHLSTKRRLNFLFICTTSYWITFAMVICHMIRVLLWFRLIKNLPSNYTACC